MVETGGARLGDGLQRPPGVVGAVQQLQYPWPDALHAERDACRPDPVESLELSRHQTVGIGLDRDLQFAVGLETIAECVEDRRDLGRGEHGGRAAAEEDAGEGRTVGSDAAVRQVDLGDRAGHVPFGRRSASGVGQHVGVERAVAAATFAERHVHVDAQRPHGPSIPGAAIPGGSAEGHLGERPTTPVSCGA